jgi:hypothetical protein
VEGIHGKWGRSRVKRERRACVVRGGGG